MRGPDHQTQTVTVGSTDGVELALHRLGGAGRPLIICHATGFHGRAYMPLARSLRDGFEVWAVDFRGHGASTAPSSGIFTWEGITGDLLACLPALGDGPVLAVGHSLGGAVVLKAHLIRPDAFTAAYLFEPVVFPASALEYSGPNPMSETARRRRPTFASKQAALERYSTRPPLNELSSESMAAYVEFGLVDTPEGEVALACTPENEARVFDATDRLTLERLHAVDLPTMIAAGADDRVGSLTSFSRRAAELIEGATLSLHPELGHFGPLESPERVGAEILDWLGAVTG